MKIYAIGGYSQIGKNMTAIEVEDEIIILDCGVWMEKIAAYEEGDAMLLDAYDLIKMGAIPDDSIIAKKRKNVKAILITHAHLDHLGAATKLLAKYNAPIILTPFTAEVLKKLEKEDRKLPNKIVKLNPNQRYKVSKNFEIEFIHVTHSTPQTVIIAIYTKEGTVIYANDWKFDEYPTLGKRTNYKRLKQIGKEGVKLLISDSTKIDVESKTYSESVVRAMLRDILFHITNKKNLILFTTFASHISRISLAIQYAKMLGREPILIGRSIATYWNAAIRANIINEEVEVHGRGKGIKSALKKVEKNREKYLVIATGSQGEPNSVLDRISKGELPFSLLKDDQIVFSCSVIPSPVNMAHRAELERRLKSFDVRIFKDVHVSGHASREDHREMLRMLQPEVYLPTHGGLDKLAKAIELATDEGYKLGYNTFILQDGQTLDI